MRIAWDFLINGMKEKIAGLLDDFSNLPFAKGLAEQAEKIRASITQIGKDMLAENRKNLEEQLAILDAAVAVAFQEIEDKFKKSEDAKEKASKESVDKIVKNNEDAANKIKSIWDKLKDFMQPGLDAIKLALQDVGAAIGDSMTDNLSDAILGVKTWRDAVLNIVNDMTTQITRAFTRMFLQQVFSSAIFGGPTGLGSLLFPALASATPVPTQGFAKGGIVNPVFAARGFVARGTDTVPAMLTPGERVLTVDQNKAFENMGGGKKEITINVNAIDTQTGIAFLLKNKNVIASALQGAVAGNHPFRRGG